MKSHIDLSLTVDNASATEEDDWIDGETLASKFKDHRLSKRFRTVLSQLYGASAESIPWACQDWANAKAAYRFFDNERVSETDILAGHFRSTRERFAGTSATILVLHDTTEFSYQRENIGLLHKPRLGPSAAWRKKNPICGLSMHSSLAVTTAGLPLGLAAARFWTRNKFKGTTARNRIVNATRVPIEEKESMRWLLNLRESTSLLGEPQRCVHIGDRESDIYELFCAAQDAGTHFLVRTCVNRLLEDGSTVAEEMEAVPIKGLHRIELRNDKGEISEVTLELRYRRMKLRPPVGKQDKYAEQVLTVIHATERNAPQGREPIEWKLLTNLPVGSREQAIEKLKWYALRWKIEVFHKILKSGCKVEASGLQTAERLTRLIATCCIVAWRIYWMTMINRTKSTTDASVALTTEEIEVLDRLIAKKNGSSSSIRTLSDYILQIAKLGGYLARASDPDPGNTIMWRGLSHLADITLGFSLRSKIVGN
jgi:Transposase DNA-binding/Transposase Tn5 dimerisation domain